MLLIFFLLTAKLTFGQINNGGFEVWDSTYTACYDAQLINDFAVSDPSGGEVNDWSTYWCGTARTTDSYAGNYALILYTWYSYAEAIAEYHDSLSYRPQYLQGYFKYITGGINGISHGTAIVALTRFNGTSHDTIATGMYQFDSAVSFTPFQMTLNYISAAIPDSIYIYIINAANSCGQDAICNLLYLDNLILTDSPLGIVDLPSSEDALKIFPNPFSSQTTLYTDRIFNNATLTIYNSFGHVVKQIENISGQIINLDRDNLPSGLYFVQLSEENKTIAVGKLIITDE